jgi:hypothetical protein
MDAPAAAMVVNRLVESWVAQHERTHAVAAEQAHTTAQAKLDEARRQLAQNTAEYEAIVNQIISAAGPALDSDSQQNVAEQAAAKMRANLERRAAELRTQRTAMLETRTSEHPEVIAAGEELTLLESRLRELQSESPAACPAKPGTLREQVTTLRRRTEASRVLCDRLADAERAAHDQVLKMRDQPALVWFPATGVSPQRDSAIPAWHAVIVLSAVLLAGLACMLVPQAPFALHTIEDVERAVGVPVVGVIPCRDDSLAA